MLNVLRAMALYALRLLKLFVISLISVLAILGSLIVIMTLLDGHDRTHWDDAFKNRYVTSCVQMRLPLIGGAALHQCECVIADIEKRGFINPKNINPSDALAIDMFLISPQGRKLQVDCMPSAQESMDLTPPRRL